MHYFWPKIVSYAVSNHTDEIYEVFNALKSEIVRKNCKIAG